MTTQSPDSRRKRVLVAEDDEAIASMLVKVLGQAYDVVCATSGAGAVALAAEQPPPDLLLLDVMMPGLDGFATAAQIRTISHLRSVPIIFLTARTAPLDVIKGIQHGAKHYIHKPFKIEDVLSKVKKTIGE